MARSRRGQRRYDSDATAGADIPKFTISNAQYTGDLYAKVKWTWEPNWEQKLGINGAFTVVRIYHDTNCDNGFTLPTDHQAIGANDTLEFVLNESNALWTNAGGTSVICVHVEVDLDSENPTHTSPEKIGTLTLLSYGNTPTANAVPIEANEDFGISIDINVPPSDALLTPIYSCPPDSSYKDGSMPIWSSEGGDCPDPQLNGVKPARAQQKSSKLIWIWSDENTSAPPAEGTVISMDLNSDEVAEGAEGKEYYVAGTAVAAVVGGKLPWERGIGKKPYDFSVGGNARRPTGAAVNFYGKAIRVVGNEAGGEIKVLTDSTGDDYNVIHVDCGCWVAEPNGCDDCADNYDSSGIQAVYANRQAAALTELGFGLAITNTAFGNGQLDHAVVDPSDPQRSDDITWTEMVTAGFKREELFSFPNSCGSRAYIGGMKQLSPDETYRMTMESPTVFTYHLERAINQQFAMHRVIKGTLHRSLGVPDGGYLEKGDGGITIRDAQGNIVPDKLRLTEEQLEIGIKQIVKSRNMLDLSIAKEGYYKFDFSYSIEHNYEEIVDSVGTKKTESKNWSASLNAQIAGLAKWCSRKDSTAAVAQEFAWWKDDVFDIAVNIEGGGSFTSQEVINNTSIDSDGAVTIDKEFSETMVNQSHHGQGELKISSIDMTYRATIFNGLDFEAGGASWTPGGDIEGFSNFSLSGKIKDKVRFVIDHDSDGGTNVGLGMSIDLLKKSQDAGWNVPGMSKLKSSTLNLGLICSNIGGANHTLTPKASIANVGKKGFSQALDLQNGTGYVQKKWSHNFKSTWDTIRNDPSIKKFDLNYYVRADHKGWKNHGTIPTVYPTAGADLKFEKSLVEWDGIAGRLLFTANISLSANPQMAGWQVGANIVWENNILKWFGFPFNIHPSIGLQAGGAFQFGDYVDDPNALKDNPLTRYVKSSHRYRINIGPVQWNIVMAESTFREHLQARHDSVFGILGLGQCPLLKKLGDHEPIWKYILRTGPVNALNTLNEAHKKCSADRRTEFESNYRNIANFQRSMYAFFTNNYPAAANKYKFGTPLCGSGGTVLGNNHASKASHVNFSAKKHATSSSMDKEQDVIDKWEGQYSDHDNPYDDWHNVLAANALINPSPNAAWIGGDNLNTHPSPFPCLLTNHQLIAAANIKTLEWDKSNNKCACVRTEFTKLMDAAYENYDFETWEDEFYGGDGADDMGVMTRGLTVLENTTVNFVLDNGLDPEDSTKMKETPQFQAANFPVSIQGSECEGNDTVAECFDKVVFAKMTNIVNSCVDPNLDDDGDGQSNADEILEEIAEWQKGTSWWKEQGVCGGLGQGVKWLLNGVKWVYDTVTGLPVISWVGAGVGKLLPGPSPDQMPLPATVYTQTNATNACATPVLGRDPGNPTTPTTPTPECYEYYRFWTYYLKGYKAMFDFLSHSHYGSRTLFGEVAFHWANFSTVGVRSANPWVNWAEGQRNGLTSSASMCWDTTVTAGQMFVTRQVADMPSWQKDLLKTYMILKSENLDWGRSQIDDAGGIDASAVDYTDVMSVADVNPLPHKSELHAGFANNVQPSAKEFLKQIGFYILADGNIQYSRSLIKPDEGACEHGTVQEERDELDSIADAILKDSSSDTQYNDDNLKDEDNQMDPQEDKDTYAFYLNNQVSAHTDLKNRVSEMGVDRSLKGLGRQQSVILAAVVRILGDPILYYINSSSVTSSLYTDSTYGLVTMYTKFKAMLDEFGSLAGGNSAAGRRSAGKALAEFESYYSQNASGITTQDDIHAQILPNMKKYMDSFKAYFRASCLEALCENDAPLQLLAYVPKGMWSLNARLDANGRGSYANKLFDIIYGTTRNSDSLPDFMSVSKSTGTWAYSAYTDNASVASGWATAVNAYSNAMIIQMKADKVVNSYAHLFSQGSLGSNVASVATNISNLKSQSYGTNLSSNSGYYYYIKLTDNHWSIVQSIYHSKSRFWIHNPTSMDWCDITLYGYNVSNGARLNPWFADPQGANLDESRPFKTIVVGSQKSRINGSTIALTFKHAQNSFRFYLPYINKNKKIVFERDGNNNGVVAPYEDNNHNPSRGDDWAPE